MEAFIVIRAWQKVFSATVFKNEWIHLSENSYLNSGKRIDPYFLFHGREHVVVVPMTADQKIVLVQLYRPGTNAVGWELPAGCIETSDRTAVAAAHRELLEETGYAGDATYVQRFAIDSSRQTNFCHVIAIKNCRKVNEQQLDDSEEILVQEFDLPAVEDLIFTNQFCVGGQIGALYLTIKRGLL